MKKRKQYSYKQTCISNYGEIFNLNHIATYSQKIFTILQRIKKSTGVVLVFSQYLDSGCIPLDLALALALALEELGYRPFSGKSKIKPLFSKPCDSVDVFSGYKETEHTTV